MYLPTWLKPRPALPIRLPFWIEKRDNRTYLIIETDEGKLCVQVYTKIEETE